ncbi:MAG: N-acetylneuraminate synthase family protein, partial [Gammaproteobacteria bacterium]
MQIKISSKVVGDNCPVFIVAELSANHVQDFEIAVRTVHVAKEAGADAIKLQTYKPDSITIDADNDFFRLQKGSLHYGKTLYQVYQEAYTPWEWQPKLKKIAEDLGLICFSSPFDFAAVDFLEAMNVPAYKVASLEITDIPLLEYVASKGKPIILSSGIATLSDIEEAISVCEKAGNGQLSILKCTSAYPTPFTEMNLRAIPYLSEKFGVIIGLSDHTLGISAAIAAVTLGAK